MQPAAQPACYEPAMDSPTESARHDGPDPRPALAADLDRAFPAFVEAEAGRVYSIALRLTGQPADAEDLAQDALVRAYRALCEWEPQRIRELAVRPWLASIVVNLARNRARARAARPASVSLIDELAHPRIALQETPHGRHEHQETTEEWAARLLTLPERYRAPLVLRHVDGLSYHEIGEALARPAGTVKAQVHRGLALLRAALAAETATQPHSDRSTQRQPVEVAR